MHTAVYLALSLTVFNALQACGMAPHLAEPIVQPVDNPRTQTQRGPHVEPALLEAVQVWKEDCATFSALHCGSFLNRVDSISTVVDFGEEDKYTLGRCLLRSYGLIVTERRIQIRADLLKYPATLRAVLAHELGHCAFLKNHVDDESHLMAPYLLHEKTLGSILPVMLQRFYADIQANNLPSIGGLSNGDE